MSYGVHMQTKTTPVVVYARVSTVEQARSGLGIEAQVDQCAAYCRFRGLTVVEVIIDDGVSGSVPMGTRPNGQRAVELLTTGRAVAIVAAKLDRLFRDAADCLSTTRAWTAQGVDLHLLDLGVDTTTAMGRAFLTMSAGFAELERNVIRERTSGALRALRAQGVKLGPPAYGQARTAQDTSGRRRSWTDVPEEQRALELMRGMRAQGETLRAIVAALTEQGVRTKRGGAWAPTTVARILERLDRERVAA